ncbi:DEAD/DEAH box helicase [Allobaculum stercoricanis]|uniref:DEAD/DEAH box helicase n=1 Tax=Allobaculum stercoricanis TaxID=174709 RepID=UPI0023F3DBD9|nr:DEAD/DEAH box helicase [Allobaculum stercoricanis]
MMNRIEEMMKVEGFKTLTPIQEAVIHRKDKQRDLIGISTTGSGKSHAFFMPIFEAIDASMDEVQAVISVPTRELAWQLYERCKKLADHFDVRIRLVTGGMEKKEGGLVPHIVIGTPGRMKDLFLDDQTLLLNTAKIMVIDEADMTMEFGFLEDVDMILSHMSQDITVMVFSATIPEMLQPFLKKYLNNPELIRISSNEEFAADIEHYLIPLKHKTMSERVLDVLSVIHPYVCLIFANSNQEAATLAHDMRQAGYDLVELHGDLEARERSRAIRQIQSQKKSYIVASDIASRGIDLEGITHVISCGFPKDLKFYEHRSGRTGRAGRDGLAIAIASPKDQQAVVTLRKRGIDFKEMDIKDGHFVEVKDRTKRNAPNKKVEMNAELGKVVHKKAKKVKPNYKKKRAQELENVKRRAKRAMIRKEIQQQKRERAKAKQRAKREQ